MRRLGCLLVCVLGCGDDAVAPDAPVADAAPDARIVDASPDAAPDAPGAALAATSGGAPVTTIALASTSVGQSATASLMLTNGGAMASGPIAIAIQGTHANDYSLDNQLTTCAGMALAAGASCTIALVFRPTAAGARTASLTYTSVPGGTGTISLSGPGVMPDLHFMPTSLDFATVRLGMGTSTPIELRNDGAGPAPIDSITVTGAGFSRGTSTCGATLAANSSCDISIDFLPTTLGARTGSVAVSSGGTVYSAGLSAIGARDITIVKSGTGTGTITSTPAGLNCGATCTALFPDDVLLTAVLGPSTVLTGWSIPACGTSLTCNVPADVSPVTVTASFALTGSAMIAVTFAGDATGEVRVRRNSTPVGVLATCFASCSIHIEPGDQITFAAATVSTFGGFSGACTGTSNCTFTAGVGTSAVTATFTKDPKERWTRLLADPVNVAKYDGTGNLIVGTETQLIKLSTTGSTVWALPMQSVRALDTGPGDSIYVVNASGLQKLDATSGITWTRALPTEADGVPPFPGFANSVAVGADGAVAVQGATGFAHWSSAGAMSWARTGSNLMRQGIGIEPGGAVVVARLSTEDIFGDRFAAADGTPLTGLGDIGDKLSGGLDLDANGRLVTSYSGGDRVILTWGGLGYGDMFGIGGSVPNGVASSLTGDVISGISTFGNTAWTLRRLSATAVETWVLKRFTHTSTFMIGFTGTTLRNVAVSTTGQAAAVGTYYGFTTSPGVGWVQVFDP